MSSPFAKAMIHPVSTPRAGRGEGRHPALALALALILATLAAGWHLGAPGPSVSAAALQAGAIAVVSAADSATEGVAPESLAVIYGANLALRTETAVDVDPNAPGVQLPTELGGTRVTVNARPAGLLYVAPGQINLLVPADVSPGAAAVEVIAGNGVRSAGTVMIKEVAPGIFTANQAGTGVPAGQVLYIKANGQRETQNLFRFENGVAVPEPISLAEENREVFLVLAATGLRRARREAVSVIVGGRALTPDFVGPQSEFAGLDQVNVKLDPRPTGIGPVNIELQVTAFGGSNQCQIEISGGPSAQGPEVTGFSAGTVLAGDELRISGSRFATNPNAAGGGNIVLIGGVRTTEVRADSPSQLTVRVPYGVKAGPVEVSVATPQGSNESRDPLQVRTSYSGQIESTENISLRNVTVSVKGRPEITPVKTGADGNFVIPDLIPNRAITLAIDGTTVVPGGQAGPIFDRLDPYAKVLPIANQDTKLEDTVSLQQVDNVSVTVPPAGGTPAAPTGGPEGLSISNVVAARVENNGVIFEVADDETAVYPPGAAVGSIFLTLVRNSRTPVALPAGIFSQTIVQLTPFNVRLTKGGKLTFPNLDNIAGNDRANARLYYLDLDENSPTVGTFIEAGPVTFSADGRQIVTAENAIKVTSYYFVAFPRPTTTVIGRVLDSDGRTPVQLAQVRARGREVLTDGSGGFSLRDVPVIAAGESISVEADFLRASGRVDRASGETGSPVVGGLTGLGADLVLSSGNRPPSIFAPGSLTAPAGKATTFSLGVNDPDETGGSTAAEQVQAAVTVSVTGAGFASVSNPVNGVFTLMLNPGPNDTGNFTLVLIASDGQAETRQTIQLTITPPNRAPAANAQSVSTNEDTAKAITLTGTDPDGNTLSYTVLTQPAHGTLSGTAPNLTYQPAADYNGPDSFTFKVSDGQLESAAATVTITVNPVNDPPSIRGQSLYRVDEGVELSFTLTAEDPDAGQRITFSATGLPAGATFSASTGRFSWTPTFNQSGTYQIIFRATDNGTPPLTGELKIVQIIVGNVDRRPVLTVPGTQRVDEGQALTFTVSATDPDAGQIVTLAATGLPTGASFNPATRQFSWTPTFSQAGTYQVTFTATDNGTPPLTSDPGVVQIIVAEVNQRPVLSPASGRRTVDEGQALAFTVSATDPDAGQTVTLAATGLPTGASFNPATGQFSWTPTFSQAGTYQVTFTATDNGTPPLSSQPSIIEIVVNDVNRRPVLTVPGTQRINEGQALTFTVSATDPDAGQTVTLAATGLPTGASFNPATGQFSWTPTFSQAGTYQVTFTATDNGTPPLTSDPGVVQIVVSNVNQPPVITVPGAQTVTETQTLTFTVSATDPDVGQPVTLAATGLPTGASFNPATGQFSWTPTRGQAGTYQVIFSATDNGTPPLGSSGTVQIVVNMLNDPPVVTIDGDGGTELIITAEDPNPGQTLTLEYTPLPPGTSIRPAGPNRWIFTLDLDTIPEGSYSVTFTATDNGVPPLSGSETLSFTILRQTNFIEGQAAPDTRRRVRFNRKR